MNKITLHGRIHSTPKLEYLSNTAIVTFLFATVEYCGDGRYLETTIHRVAAFRSLAETLGRLSVGTTLFVQGKVSTRLTGSDDHPSIDATVIASRVRVSETRPSANPPPIQALAAEATAAVV